MFFYDNSNLDGLFHAEGRSLAIIVSNYVQYKTRKLSML